MCIVRIDFEELYGMSWFRLWARYTVILLKATKKNKKKKDGIYRVRWSGPRPLLGESSTFRRGVRARSSETGWLFQPHLPLLAFGVDELGIFAKRCFDCGNMTSSWPQKCHFFPQRGAREIIKNELKDICLGDVSCAFPWKSRTVVFAFFNCFALRFVFRGGSSVVDQVLENLWSSAQFISGRDGAQLFFGGFKNCLAEKIFTPLIQTGWAKCVRVGRAHLNSSEIAHPLPDEFRWGHSNPPISRTRRQEGYTVHNRVRYWCYTLPHVRLHKLERSQRAMLQHIWEDKAFQLARSSSRS